MTAHVCAGRTVVVVSSPLLPCRLRRSISPRAPWAVSFGSPNHATQVVATSGHVSRFHDLTRAILKEKTGKITSRRTNLCGNSIGFSGNGGVTGDPIWH